MARIIWHTFGALATLVFMLGFMSMVDLQKDPGRYPAFAPWAAGAATIIGAMGLLQYGHWYRTGKSIPIFHLPRFSLRTLLVVVTVAAIVAWYLRPAEIQIIGDIRPADVASLCQFVDDLHLPYKEPILSIRLLAPGKVEVTSGEVRGPLDGGGSVLILEKLNGAWIIVSSSHWIS